MRKTDRFILFVSQVLVLCISCSVPAKRSLKKGDLTGYCGIEIVKGDSSIIHFITDTTFIRKGNMYVQSSGKYSVRGDTLKVNYYCEKKANKNGEVITLYGVQTYILIDNKILKLLQMSSADGVRWSPANFDQELELYKCASK